MVKGRQGSTVASMGSNGGRKREWRPGFVREIHVEKFGSKMLNMSKTLQLYLKYASFGETFTSHM